MEPLSIKKLILKQSSHMIFPFNSPHPTPPTPFPKLYTGNHAVSKIMNSPSNIMKLKK